MLNASVGVQRVLSRVRRPSSSVDHPTPAPRLRARSAAAHPLRPIADTRWSARWARSFRPVSLPSLSRPSLSLPTLGALGRLGHERTLAVVVAIIVLTASLLSMDPGKPSRVATADAGSGTTAAADLEDAIAAGAAVDPAAVGDVEAAYVDASIDDLTGPDGLAPASSLRSGIAADLAAAEVTGDTGAVEGPFLADGTLLKPVAVDTSVDDGSDLVTRYKVKAGDTLVGIAQAHGVSMMTLYWANKLKSKTELHIGQVLKIPPVSGLVVTVQAGDTLAALAAKYKVSEARILRTNEISDPSLVVGQVLIVPGAKGKPIPTAAPKPSHKPAVRQQSRTASHSTARAPRTYSGGAMRWPTTSHHISQYFHYGHYAIDIDGSTGDPIWAAAGGTVLFAGWKNNGGGYQVWIAHGSGLYTTYNHMSSVAVGRGQHVGKGQRVGRMGATGDATGSHLHFEVWRGPIWNGGTRVNPLRYL